MMHPDSGWSPDARGTVGTSDSDIGSVKKPVVSGGLFQAQIEAEGQQGVGKALSCKGGGPISSSWQAAFWRVLSPC